MDVATGILLLVVNIPIFLFYGKLIFEDWQSFFEAVGWWLTPDIISRLNGQLFDDLKGTLALMLFAGLSIATVWGEHSLFQKFF